MLLYGTRKPVVYSLEILWEKQGVHQPTAPHRSYHTAIFPGLDMGPLYLKTHDGVLLQTSGPVNGQAARQPQKHLTVAVKASNFAFACLPGQVSSATHLK